jgi:hypothetical protein
MRKTAAFASVLLGLILIIGGAATWVVVATTLADQKIVTSDDACLSGRQVADPFTAYCQAKVIEKHTLEATDGFYYAELARDDPRREVALTSSFLQASLFTSILAFGVAAMAVGMGILFVLIGMGINDVARRLGDHPPRAA